MNTPKQRPIVIGTRGSDLALWQANHIQDTLRRHHGQALDIRLEVIVTEGDRIQDRPLYKIGGKGLFVKGIEEQLLDGRVDLAVHSMKDLPARPPPGLEIACTPQREDPRDALVGAAGATLAKLPAGTRVGTGSLRRGALARRINPGIEIVPIRGNVPTRVGKVDSGELDFVILAAAGLRRLGLEERICESLDVERYCPAPAQGILALECRADDDHVKQLLRPLSHPETTACAAAERAFLAELEASCTVPVGCFAEVRADDVLTVHGLVIDPSGRPCFMASKVGHPRDAATIGTALAQTLLRLGAGKVIEALQAVA